MNWSSGSSQSIAAVVGSAGDVVGGSKTSYDHIGCCDTFDNGYAEVFCISSVYMEGK